MQSKWKSRKFLLAVSAQLTALLVLLWPTHESAIIEASRSLTSLVVVVLTAFGYMHAEASIDRQRGQDP